MAPRLKILNYNSRSLSPNFDIHIEIQWLKPTSSKTAASVSFFNKNQPPLHLYIPAGFTSCNQEINIDVPYPLLFCTSKGTKLNKFHSATLLAILKTKPKISPI